MPEVICAMTIIIASWSLFNQAGQASSVRNVLHGVGRLTGFWAGASRVPEIELLALDTSMDSQTPALPFVYARHAVKVSRGIICAILTE